MMKAVDVAPEEMRWRHVGGGVHCRAFINAENLITTTATGPPMVDIVRRVVRDLSTGKVIDICQPDITPDRILNRSLGKPTHIMVEVTTKDAEKMYKTQGPDITEIFSQPRVAYEASLKKYCGRQLRPGWSLDLTLLDPVDGKPWDLSKPDKIKRLWQLVIDGRPYVIIGSPPCTPFSILQGLNAEKRDPEMIKAEIKAATAHMDLCAKIYRYQISCGRFFVHEHPATASSWKLPSYVRLAADETVQTVMVDMCAHGMKGVDADGIEKPIMKPTKILTNSPEIAK